MSETPTIEQLQTYAANLQAGASIIYSVLNRVYQLHDVDEAENCAHCEVAYPCETAQILLEHMVPDEEEEPDEAA